MNQDKIDSLVYFFNRYGGQPRIQVDMPTTEIFSHNRTATIMAGFPTISLNVDFRDRFMFETLAGDLAEMNNLLVEKAVRERNPAVQRAYEEYQLILRLSK